MVDAKEISNRMFSLFISLDSADSVIKFGGYDKSGVANGSPFHMLTSQTDDYWSFALTSVKAGGVELDATVDRSVQFNPAFPWIYMPTDQFEQFAKAFE